MLNKIRLGIVSAFSLMMMVQSGMAQDRTNPFTPPTSEQEKQALMDERVRNIVWELQPDLKALIMQDVHAAQASMEMKMRRYVASSIDDLDRGVNQQSPTLNVAGGGDGESADGVVVDNSVLENSTFISCVNGKALYRDSKNTLFQVANSGNGNQPCGG